jgi:SAM-dependent methyltransferase
MFGQLQQRRIVPEILDALPASDPQAIASRRDLVWVNALMLQSRIMAALLRRHVRRAPQRILELGCGDGAFMLAVAQRSGWRNVEVVMVDQIELVTQARKSAFAELGWRAVPVVDDIFQFVGRPGIGRFDVICVNLVLHHFDDAALAELFNIAAALAPVFVATEPRRSGVALVGCALMRLIGVSDVTKHDARASVCAGFIGQELTSLWPSRNGFILAERQRGLFTHAFCAESMQ